MIFLLTQYAFAGDGAHVPSSLTLIAQTTNVALLLGAIVYFAGKNVRSYFQQKRQDFLMVAEKAQAAQKAAEQDLQSLQRKIDKLESEKAVSLMRAQAEAQDLKKQLLAEAEALTQRMIREAEKSAQMEVEKAKMSLRQEMLTQALSMTRDHLAQQVTVEDHARLQGEFIANLQQAGPR